MPLRAQAPLPARRHLATLSHHTQLPGWISLCTCAVTKAAFWRISSPAPPSVSMRIVGLLQSSHACSLPDLSCCHSYSIIGTTMQAKLSICPWLVLGCVPLD